MFNYYNEYMVRRGRGNLRYIIYQRRSFMFIKYWSLMCVEPCFSLAETIVNNLRLINDSKSKCGELNKSQRLMVLNQQIKELLDND